jgi:C-terminal processing protease CtpA/Prc
VNVKKGPRGLGLSVSGGSDSNSNFPGLIRIKRLFPHQAAWATGRLLPGDIILDVNGVTLTGLTNYVSIFTFTLVHLIMICLLKISGSSRSTEDNRQ